jgi:propanol-preferring alcohol dehydrogenase
MPIILGHQVVGRVKEAGRQAQRFACGDRVGIAWIFSACGTCELCQTGNENLCPDFQATGRDANGGYARLIVVREDYAFPLPDQFSDVEAAPLLCAGAIGYRSLRLCNLIDGQNLGLTGFGASGHLVLKMVRHRFPNSNVFVFARNPSERAFARELGAVWSGDTARSAPEKLHSIIDTTPVWKPVVEALKNLAPGGRLVINAIRKEQSDKKYLTRLDYSSHLWMEKEIKSVANVTRKDVSEFLELAAEMALKPEVQEYALEEANDALVELKTSKIRGAKVLTIH